MGGQDANFAPFRARQPQVFARDIRLGPDAPLVYLPRGAADTLRDDAATGHLVCPLPYCRDPRLWVRGTTQVRDHFAHRSGAHAPETLAHHAGKHLVGAWLRHAYPDAVVDVDTRETESGARPDVLLSLATGRQVAYEVQLAHLSVDEWLHRHQRYRDEGIRDVWLFGGTRYYRPSRGRTGETDALDLGPVVLEVLNSGHPLLFLDSATEQLGWAVGDGVIHALGGAPSGGKCRAEWFELSVCRSVAGVLDLPGLREQLLRGREFRQQVVDDRNAHDALKRSAQLRDERWQLARAGLESDRKRPLPAVVDHFEEEAGVPHADDTRARAHERDQLLRPWSPAQWRWLIMAELDHHVGATLTMRSLLDAALPGHEHLDASWQRQRDTFLAQLRDIGHLWFAGPTGPVEGEGILVLSGEAGEGVLTPGPHRRLLTSSPVRLIESPSVRIVWQADQSVQALRFRTTQGRSTTRWSALPPGVKGTVFSATPQTAPRGCLPPLP